MCVYTHKAVYYIKSQKQTKRKISIAENETLVKHAIGLTYMQEIDGAKSVNILTVKKERNST